MASLCTASERRSLASSVTQIGSAKDVSSKSSSMSTSPDEPALRLRTLPFKS